MEVYTIKYIFTHDTILIIVSWGVMEMETITNRAGFEHTFLTNGGYCAKHDTSHDNPCNTLFSVYVHNSCSAYNYLNTYKPVTYASQGRFYNHTVDSMHGILVTEPMSYA